jgi:hypothetical protein
MTRRRLLVLLPMAALLFLVVPDSQAADQLTVPTTIGQSTSVTWTGTTLPGANATSDCSGVAVSTDPHDVSIVVPLGAYTTVSVAATATISYDGNTDMIATVVAPNGQAQSSDSGGFDTDESVSFGNPPAGTYRIIACPFAAAAPQAYTGTLTLTAGPPSIVDTSAPCSAPGKALTFSTPTYVDMTRAGGEPSVVQHPDGTLLYAAHAGTTHFYSLEADDPTSEAFFEEYRGQVHAWYSTDHGKTWNFVDRTLPPDNAPGSGFSDPDFAIDAAGNTYLSEINLANVAMSKSTTSGKSYTLQNFFAEDITDRQWSAAGPANVVFLDGNPEESGGTVPTEPVGNSAHTIYRSLDGGKTFSEGIADGGGLGDIVFDQAGKTLYEAHLSGGTLQIASFRRALDPVAATALTPEISSVATGVSMLSHWPAIDVDTKGNVYMVWDESGAGTRAAGIWYSYSTTAGRTWAKPTRVDPDNHTDIWPWIAVGDPGKVAIAWMGNDHALAGSDAETAGPDDPWNIYVAQTQNGLGCLNSTSPGFRTSRATPDPFHVGTICMGGTTCQAMLIDRRLGDYFTIDIDATGAVVAAYSDTREGGAVSLPAFVRQSGGSAFQKGPPIKSK